MGNQIACMAKGLKSKTVGGRRKIDRNDFMPKSKSGSVKGKGFPKKFDQDLMQQQLAMALVQQQQKTMAKLERTLSQRASGPKEPKQGAFPRSASTRARSVTDPVVHPSQLVDSNLDAKADENLETKHFVLIHGGGYGAWCWYKSIALLKEAGFVADAINLTGSGIDFNDPDKVTSLAHYAKPLTEYLTKLSEKVILVGHNVGGACISYAMELFPNKIAKAVFVAASMVTDGQRAIDAFAGQSAGETLLAKAQLTNYGNGNNSPPTSLEFDQNLLSELFYNMSSSKDLALAAVSMRPVPFAPVVEKVSLSKENYGSVRRFFIGPTDDRALPASNQEALLARNPPEKSFTIKSDHSPFFSRPHALHKLLIEIARLEAPT